MPYCKSWKSLLLNATLSRFLTAPFPRLSAVFRVHRARPGGRIGAVRPFCALTILPGEPGPCAVRIQVIVESEPDAVPVVHEVATLERDGLQPENLGLMLAEAKDLLREVQETIVAAQVAVFEADQVCCPDCGRRRRRNGRHPVVYRTLFGKLRLDSPRFYACPCQEAASRASLSPLAERLPERTAPELAYLESKFAALMSYGLTVELLAEVLPLGEQLAQTSVRRQVQRVAERAEGELGDEQFTFIEGCQRDWDQLPRPEAPLTVGLDGGYVHACHPPPRTEGWFEVIAGKSQPDEGAAKCFAFVATYDVKPKRRLFETLRSQGLQMNQRVTFLTDGGNTVRELPWYLCPESEHWLDWFHVMMRLTVMGQMAKGLALERVPVESPGSDDDEEALERLDVPALQKQLESLKWHLWHGNVYRALQILEDLERDLDTPVERSERAKKLLKAVSEFRHYIEVNGAFIPNYGDRYRHGEAIASSIAESTVNQVVSKRMVKKQQMRWTQRGAHLLLQVRTRVLNDDLRTDFERWYPGLKAVNESSQDAAA